MNGYEVIRGGQAAPVLGQTQDVVTSQDVQSELQSRGYKVQVPHTPIHHAPVAPTLTKKMAISVAIDEALEKSGTSTTSVHPYKCPSSAGCGLQSNLWLTIVTWCVGVANGYLSGTYTLPAWAQSKLHSGTLSGAGLAGLGGFSDWVQANPWFVKSVGTTITNIGEHLTAKNVQDAIKANTDQSFSKDDALALVAALQQGGFVPQGKTGTVTQGATGAAAGSFFTHPLFLIGAAVGVVLLVMRR